MKKIAYLIAAALLCGCSTFQTFPNAATNTGITLATSAGLKFGITDATTRTDVANYINVIAGALRAVTGTPTPDQLTALINQYVPANVKTDVPEILAFVTPLIVNEYEALYSKYGTSGNAAKIAAGLNAIAGDLQAGAAPYISH